MYRLHVAQGRWFLVSRIAAPFLAASLCAMAGLPRALLAANAYPDDHGNTPEESTLLVPGGDPSNSTIEIDTDQDWFRFVALPGISYAVEVTASSIWDVVLEVRGPYDYPLIANADSATSSAPPRATVTWTNAGPAGTYYMGVSGYLKFTTGTYSIAVRPLNWTDSDKDGLPDAWETAYLHTLAWGAGDDPDGDGACNLDEYYTMTDPGLSTSALRITSISNAPGGVSFRWLGTPRSGYRVRRADSARATAWTAVGTNYNMSDQPQTMQWNDVSVESARVYRVEFMISN